MRNRMKKFFACLLVVLCGLLLAGPNVLTAEAARKNPTIGPGGGGGLYNSKINPQNDDNIVMTTDMSGSFTTIDGAESFRQINLLGSAKYSFDPHNPNVVFAYHRQMYISEDYGQTYKRLYPSEENIDFIQTGFQEGAEPRLKDNTQLPSNLVFDLQVDPADPNVMYYIAKAGSDGYRVNNAMIHKSTDRGKTWEMIAEFPEGKFTNWRYSANSFEKYMKLQIVPHSDPQKRTINVYTSDGFYKLVDDGSKTLETVSDITSRSCDYVYDEATQKTTVYIVENEITFDEEGKELLAFKDVMRSDDGCQTWTNISKNYSEPDAGTRTYFAVAASKDRVYMTYTSVDGKYFTLGSGIAVSSDRGATWETSMKGWDTTNITKHNWVEVFGSTMGVATLGWNSVNCGMSVSKTNPDIAVNTNVGNAYITKDGGKTWQDTNSDFDLETQTGTTRGIDQITSWDVDVDPFDSNHMFLSYSDVGLFESKDGGKTWKKPQNNGLPPNPYYSNSAYAFAFDPDIEGFCLSGFTGIHDMNIGSYVVRVIKLAKATAENANRPYETFTGGVVRSTNGGETWTHTGKLGTVPIRDDDGVSGLPDRAVVTDLVIDPYSPKKIEERVVYATCMGYGVYKSEDGGLTWKKFITGMEDAKAQTPWRLTWNSDYSRLYVIFAPTGGAAPGEEAAQLALIDYHPDDGPVYYLERGAKEWTKLASMPVSTERDPMPDNRKGLNYVCAFNGLSIDSKGNLYAAGRAASVNGNPGHTNYGGVWLSQDDGESWQRIYTSTANVYDVTVDSRNDDVLYMCNTVGGEVYVSYKGTETTEADWIKMDDFQHMVPTRVMEDTQNQSKMYVTTFGGGIWHLDLPETVVTENHTLTYDGNGNSGGTAPVDSASPYQKKDKANLSGPGSLTKNGQTFVGWNTKADGTGKQYEEGDEYLIVTDTKLYAQWRESDKQYSLSYDGNGHEGGTVPADSQAPYALSGEVEVLEGKELQKDGQVFTGWNTKADGSGKAYQAGQTFKIVDDTVLYAQWDKAYRITYDSCGSDSGDIPVDDTAYQKGTRVKIQAGTGLKKDGYVLRGWCTRADYKGAVYQNGNEFTINEDTVVYAHWAPGITVTYDGNGHTGGEPPVDPNSPYASGDQIVIMDSIGMVKDGYTFEGWKTEIDGKEFTLKPKNGVGIKTDTVLTAIWKKIPEGGEPRTILYRDNDKSGGTAPVDENSPYPNGSTIEILDPGDLYREGYDFVGWYDRGGSPDRIFKPGTKVTITSNMIMWPVWEEEGVGEEPSGEPCTLTYDGNGNTGGTAPVDSNSPYAGGDIVSVMANTSLERVGYLFEGWNTKADGKGATYQAGTSFKIRKDTVLYAKWKEVPVSAPRNIIYHDIGSTGGVAPVDDNAPYVNGSIVEILGCGDLVKDGFVFAGWYNKAEGEGKVYLPGQRITIIADMIMYPIWEQDTATYTLTYDGNGNTAGSAPVDLNSPYNRGDSAATLDNIDLEKDGFTFGGWNTKADGSGTSYKVGQTFRLRGDTVLYALWNSNMRTIVYRNNEATGGIPPVDVNSPYEKGSTIEILEPGSLVKEGYKFVGWYNRAEGEGKVYMPGQQVTINNDMIMWGIWEADEPGDDTCKVTYNGNGNTSGTVPVDTNSPYAKESIVTVLANSNLARTGYTFIGWNTKANGSGNAYQATETFNVTEDTVLYAQWQKDIEKYTVTYDGNGSTAGTAPADAASPYDEDSTITVLAEGSLAKAGYSFTGWNTKANGSGTAYQAADTFTITEDIVLYAQWQKDIEKYTVTYDGNGSTTGTAPVDAASPYDEDSTVTILAEGDLAKDGYSFIGWNTDANGSGTAYQAADTFTVTEDTVLYAQWQKDIEKYTVTYDGNDHTDGTAPVDAASPYDEDSIVTVLAEGELERDGYVFSGWNTQADGDGTGYQSGDTFTITEDTILYAQWEKKLNVTYDGNGHTGGTVPADAAAPYERDSVVTILGAGNLAKDGYTFLTWNTKADGSGTTCAESDTFVITEDTVLYAQWKQDEPVGEKYAVTYNGNNHTGGSAPVDSLSPYEEDSEVTVLGRNNLVKSGYTFLDWNTQADGQGIRYEEADTFFIGDEDVILYAQWEANEYTVTYDGNGHTDGTAPVDDTKYHIEETITVSDEADLAKTGYTFTGWNTKADGSGTAYSKDDTFEMEAADVILYAQWQARTYTLSFNGNGHTGGSVPADKEGLSGALIEVPGAADLSRDGHSFKGWNTKADGTGTAYQEGSMFTVGTTDTTLYAQWKIIVVPDKIEYTVTFNPDNGKAATKVTVKQGQKVSAPAKPVKAGYIFEGWYIDGDSKAFNFNSAITKNITLKAKWIPEQKKVSKISIAKAKIKVATAIYNGKRRKPTVKVTVNNKTLKRGTDFKVTYSNNIKIGTATAKITAAGNYEGTRTVKFTIRPKRNKIKGFTSKNGRVTLRFTKAKGAKGYQIRYATKKNFKGAKSKYVKKTTVTLRGLKKNKTYYFKVRSYKKVGKRRIYSTYSRVKKIKVK